MRISIRGYGDTEVLNKQLAALAQVAEDAVINQALADGGQIVVDGIRARIRKDARRATGNLERAIKYRLDSSWLTGRAYAVTFGWDKIAARTSKTGNVTYTTDYGPVLEFDGKRQLRHLEAGFEDARQEAEATMAHVIQQSIKQSA